MVESRYHRYSEFFVLILVLVVIANYLRGYNCLK